MACEYCLRTTGHAYRCPNYEPPKTKHHCAICKEGIQNGERYIENDNGELIHWYCVYDMKELLEFLGYHVKEMEDGEY